MSQYMTEQRRALMAFLEKNHDRQLSAKEIAKELSDGSISLSAVYRNLTFLEKNGHISRTVKDGSREGYYQYVKGECCKNCIHITCTSCGKTIHMNSLAAENMIEKVKELDGFEISKLKTVLYGTCKECR